jgi:hypothetical protein
VKNPLVHAIVFVLAIGCPFAARCEATTAAGYLDVGVGIVDITPTDGATPFLHYRGANPIEKRFFATVATKKLTHRRSTHTML